MQTDLYNLSNDKVGTVDLPDRWFNAPWRPSLVKQVLLGQKANKRRPWAHVKERGEVSGGGKKPWKQKGTGRARHGSTRSPIWVGGGVAHGPRKERDYTQKINIKMRREALASVLSKKFKDNEVKVFDALAAEPLKTKVISASLHKVLGLSSYEKKLDVLLVRNPEKKDLTRAARNLVKTKVTDPASINVEDALTYKNLFFDKSAIEKMK